jgi:hypothetical protein
VILLWIPYLEIVPDVSSSYKSRGEKIKWVEDKG